MSNRNPNSICFFCKSPFYKHPSHKTTLYCSIACRVQARKASNPPGKTISICLYCGNAFNPSAHSLGKYCSTRCANKYLKIKPNIECPVCHKSFHPEKKKTRFCSHACAMRSLSYGTELIPCPQCGKSFSRKLHKGRNLRRFCSPQCAQIAQHNQTAMACKHCQRQFLTWPSAIMAGKKYCSRECYFLDRSPQRKFMNKVALGHRTAIESKTEQALRELNIKYKWEYRFGKYWVDFYLPDFNLAIECDEPYWHNPKKDSEKDTWIMNNYSVAVKRITTQQINGDTRSLIKDILTMK